MLLTTNRRSTIVPLVTLAPEQIPAESQPLLDGIRADLGLIPKRWLAPVTSATRPVSG